MGGVLIAYVVVLKYGRQAGMIQCARRAKARSGGGRFETALQTKAASMNAKPLSRLILTSAGVSQPWALPAELYAL